MITVVHGTPNQFITLVQKDNETPYLKEWLFSFNLVNKTNLRYCTTKPNGSQDPERKKYVFYGDNRYFFFSKEELKTLLPDYSNFERQHGADL